MPWTVARQPSQSLGFARQEYWSRLPCPSPGIPDPESESRSPALQADSLLSEPPGIKGEIQIKTTVRYHLTAFRKAINEKSSQQVTNGDDIEKRAP